MRNGATEPPRAAACANFEACALTAGAVSVRAMGATTPSPAAPKAADCERELQRESARVLQDAHAEPRRFRGRSAAVSRPRALTGGAGSVLATAA